MDNFKPQLKGMQIASHDIDAKQFLTHCTVKNRIVFRPTHSDDEKSESIKEISKFYATVPDGAVITELSATIGTQKLSSNNWKDTVKCQAKKLFPNCKVTNYGDEIICDTNPKQSFKRSGCNYDSRYFGKIPGYFCSKKYVDTYYDKLNNMVVPGTNRQSNNMDIYCHVCRSRHWHYSCYNALKHTITYSQIGDGCEKFLHDLGEIRKYDNKSDVICAITYQVPDLSIISKRDNFVKSVRIRVPTEIDPKEGPVISAKLENMKKSRKNRSVANVNGIKIDAKIVKNTKVGKKSKQSKQRRINNDLEYDISDYYCDY